jgi:hypothetical protein
VHDFFQLLGGAPFRHRDHLRLAWLAVRESDRPIEVVGDAIRRYAVEHGAAGRYHETLTAFWVRLVAHCVAVRPELDEFDEFLDAFSFLLDKTLAERHWSRETLWSDDARARWREPDLRPLPA